MIKNQTLGLLFYLRKDKLNKDGEAPIYLRITVDGQRSVVSVNRYVDPEKWSSEGNRLKGNKEEVKEINNYLDTVKRKVYEQQRDMLDRDKLVTAENLRAAFLGLNDKKHTLLELFEHHNQQVKEKIGKGFASATHTKYETSLSHIKDFLMFQYRKSNILLTELDYKFITDLEHYFKTEKKIAHNTSLKYIRNTRKIVNIAVANDWLDKDPFMKFKSRVEDTERAFLSAEELQAIEDKTVTIPRIDAVRDIFVFSCYTGLAFADVQKLTPADIHTGIDGGKWIFTHRTKTENKSNVPLLPPVLAILEKYNNHPECAQSGKLLPVKSNQKMNAYLKELADICEITKLLTFHVARHTFATTVTLTNGVPIESVSKMLGHKSIKTTQIYAKVVETKVSNDMALLKEKLFNKLPEQKLKSV